MDAGGAARPRATSTRVYNAGTTLARDGQMDAARPYLELFLKTAPPAFYAKDLKEVEALLKR